MATRTYLPLPPMEPNDGKGVIVIAAALDGTTFIADTAVGIYLQKLHTKLLPDWTCGVGESACLVYDILRDECPLHAIGSVGFFTSLPFDRVIEIAETAIASITAQLEGIAQ